MADDWRRLSALVVGFGSIGRRHARVLREIGLTDVRVCDPDASLLDRARSEASLGRVYESLDAGLNEDPDTVFVCSPTALHVEQALAAVRAGCNVFIEKPLSVSTDGVEELADTARNMRRTVMVGHCFRFHEGLILAKRMLDDGRIGRLVCVRCEMGEYIPEVMPGYRDMYVSRYSGAYELMHDIDLALWYADRAPRRVVGIDGTFGDLGMNAPDLVELAIEFEDRRVGSVHLDFVQRARHRVTRLIGIGGTIEIEFARWDSCRVSVYDACEGRWSEQDMATDRDDMFRAEDSAFMNAAASGSHAPVDIAAGALSVKVMQAAQESSRTGQSVSID